MEFGCPFTQKCYHFKKRSSNYFLKDRYFLKGDFQKRGGNCWHFLSFAFFGKDTIDISPQRIKNISPRISLIGDIGLKDTDKYGFSVLSFVFYCPCKRWNVWGKNLLREKSFHRSEEHTSELQSRLHLVC